MIDERMKEALKRTKRVLVRHLEDLCDEVAQDGCRIKDHMTLDGFKDAVKTLRCIGEIMAKDKSGENGGDSEEDADVETASPAKSRL
ncbi:MAG: hypothetical protein J6U20_03840 [Fibrobacter sp.]|nr:hypothetical protein [Fibrobacter sp.]